MKITMAAAIAACASASALAGTFTNLDLGNFGTTSGWTNVGTSQFNSSSTISGDRPRSGNGSLRLQTIASNGKAAATFGSTRFFSGPVLGTLGDLAAGSIAFDWLVDSSTTTAAFRAPALEFAVRNAQGQSATLKWEATYNGYPSNGPGVPTDTWTTSDVSAGNFWMFTSGIGVVEQFGVSLSDWASGATFGGSPVFGADSVIVGWSVQAGSGWNDTFLGFVDNVNIAFGNGGASYSANFEVEGQVIPTPLAGVMGGAGLMLVGARRRR